MSQQPSYLMLLPVLPVLLAHLAGVVVAVILLVRQKEKSTPAILALVGFGVLFITNLASLGRSPLVRWLARWGRNPLLTANTGVGCCCSVFDVAAIVCLIIAIWQAVLGQGPEGEHVDLE